MDKNSDYIFKAFIVNAKEYDNGNKETSGAWLYFPTTKEDVSALFKEIGLPNNADSDQYFIDEYKCGNTDLEKFLSMDGDIDELNYLASRISELEDIEMTVFQAVIQTKECQSIKDAINLTYNTEHYEVIPDIRNFEELGQYLFFENERIVSLDMSTYKNFDFVSYAKEMIKDNGGCFVDGVYLKTDCAKREVKYNGNIENIPDEYRVIVPTEPQKMTVLIVPPMQEPYTKEIDTGLKSLQNEVDGSIQAIYPFEELAAIICNEKGKINGLELNRALYDDNGKIYDIVAGTFLICGLTGDSFASLPDELINKFSEQFKQPETFVQVGHDILAIPVEPQKPANLHIDKNDGIISIGNGNQNTVIRQHTQINSVDIRSVGKTNRKPSIKKTLEQVKKEQGKQPQKPPQKPGPEL